jgi:ribonuclease P protein component
MSSAGDEPKAAGSSPLATSATSAGPSAPPNGNSSSPSGFRFPKSARLLERKAFRRVYDQGSRLNSPSFALFFAPRPPGELSLSGPRIGLTTPRAVGNSVVRNRLRRHIREAIRHELPRFAGSRVDYVFHPRRPLLNLTLPQLRREVERMLRKCELAVGMV